MLDVESVLWVSAIIALGLAALRRHIKRRRKVEIEIPPFLRGTTDRGDGVDSRFKGNWTEIHPLPKHISKGED